jgi:hypothetical protein
MRCVLSLLLAANEQGGYHTTVLRYGIGGSTRTIEMLLIIIIIVVVVVVMALQQFVVPWPLFSVS